jgi:hypothetical protein
MKNEVKKANQELFDKMVTHLLTQKEQSLDPISGKCMYRGGHKTMCAVGCLISDEFYSRDLEYQSAFSAPVREAIMRSNSIKLHDSTIMLLRGMQRVHDNHTPSRWTEELKREADKYNLEWNHG